MTSINFAETLKRLREKKGLTKTELARRIGVSDVTVGHWESGKISPRMGKVEMIADILGVSTDDLLFKRDLPKGAITPIVMSLKVPLYGSISAGVPLEMIEANEWVEIPDQIGREYPDAFLLEVVGDSMNKVVHPGAYALIDPSQDPRNGDIVAVNVNGCEATLKRFFRLNNSLVLEPDSYNPEHVAKVFSNENDAELVKIIGRMVWFMAPFITKF